MALVLFLHAVTIIFTLANLTQVCQGMCGQKSAMFYSSKDKALRSHTYYRKTATSAVRCGRDCAMDEHCVSFNYGHIGHICELNNATRVEHPNYLIQLGGYSYFDENKDTPSIFVTERHEDCQELMKVGFTDNGVYRIYPAGVIEGLNVYCDMKTDGGGWIVFQRRQDGSVDFYRIWDEYERGFGDLYGEFWLGNEALQILTGSGKWQLRVDLEDWDGKTAWAKYGEFAISKEKYTLHVDLYDHRSPAGDSLRSHNGLKFITLDSEVQGTDGCECGGFHGAWWFHCCLTAHLNGKYYPSATSLGSGHGIQWAVWKGYLYSLKACSMKMRKV